MLYAMGTDDWKTLRVLVRAEREAERPADARVAGWRLRVSPNRRNRDGTFLERLVAAGLLTDAGPCDPPGKDEPVTDAVRVPGPFHRYYRLTPLGHHAAEYGEYEAAAPNEKPLPIVDDARSARLAAWVAAATAEVEPRPKGKRK